MDNFDLALKKMIEDLRKIELDEFLLEHCETELRDDKFMCWVPIGQLRAFVDIVGNDFFQEKVLAGYLSNDYFVLDLFAEGLIEKTNAAIE